VRVARVNLKRRLNCTVSRAFLGIHLLRTVIEGSCCSPLSSMAETFITTPLLVPSADGGTASHRPSREARLGQRPYFQFRLVSRCRPPELPLLLEQRNITPEDWNSFWSKINALVIKVERHEQFCLYALACVAVSVWTVAALGPGFVNYAVVVRTSWPNGTAINHAVEMNDDDNILRAVQWVSSVIPTPVLAILVALLALRLFLSRKQTLQQAIELYCKDGEEVNMFHANGYGLECELLPSEINLSRAYVLNLFILPMDRPYTRFEVYDGMLTFPGYNSSYLSSMALHANTECESVPLDDWNDFSSEMTKLYESQRQLASSAAKGFIVMLLLLVMIELGDLVTDFLYVGLLGHMIVCSIYLVYRYYRFLGAILTLVHELGMRLAPHGVYVEHRRVISLNTWHGSYERHYVYLFPAARGRNTVHDADETLSTESIRNRQALFA
jgi:hypothetical protein